MDQELIEERAMQLMLEDFYGIEDSASEVSIGSGDALGETDLDSAVFNAKVYMDAILKASSLPKLFELDNAIAREVRGLESDLQTLVYDNYTKCITAANTIGDIRECVGGMSESMGGLQEDVVKLKKSAEHLENSLDANKSKLERLSGIRQLVFNLSFLFDLPQRLRDQIETGEVKQAAKEICMASSFLERHKSIDSLDKIRKETEALSRTLSCELTVKLKNSVLVEEREEFMELLVGLGEDKVKLSRLFLELGRGELSNAVGSIPTSGSIVVSANALIFTPLRRIHKVAFKMFKQHAKDLDSFATDVLKATFDMLLSRFRELSPELLSKDLLDLIDVSDTSEPPFIRSHTDSVILLALSNCVEATFTKTDSDVLKSLCEAKNAENIVQKYSETMERLHPLYLIHDQSKFSQIVHSRTEKSLNYVAYALQCGYWLDSHGERCRNAIFSHIDILLAPEEPRDLISYAKVVQECSRTGFSRIIDTVNSMFPIGTLRHPLGPLKKKLQYTEFALLTAYCQWRSQKLTEIAVNSDFTAISVHFDEFLNEIGPLFPLDHLNRQSWVERPRVPGRRGKTARIEVEIEQMFATQADIFLLEEISMLSLVLMVIRGVLKNLTEIVRENVLSKQEARDLQVNLFAIQRMIPSQACSENRETVYALIDQVLVSVRDRCDHPNPFVGNDQVSEFFIELN